MFLQLIMTDLRKKNNEFFTLFTKALQFDSHPASSIPSYTFLIFVMFILRRLAKRHIVRRRNHFRDTVYQEIAFQWIYFYVTRAWFYIMKAFRNFTLYAETILVKTKEPRWLDPMSMHLTLFAIYTSLSLIPFFITVYNYYDDTPHGQLLTWITTNRWARTELGTSGRLMIRPREVPVLKMNDVAYRTRRSTSVEYFKSTIPEYPPRPTKSVEVYVPISSIDEMTQNEGD